MTKHVSFFIFLVAIVGISVIVLVYGSGLRDSMTSRKPTNEQVQMNQETSVEGRFNQSYGKIKLPAELSIEFVETEDVLGPVTIIVSAQSKIPVGSGTVKLKVPHTGAEAGRTEELWSGSPSDFVDETIEYVRDALPEGRYHFITIFEFTADTENSEKLAMSSSLYLDVRPTKILSSNISFAEINRIEFRKELEKRILMSMKPELENSGLKLMALEIANLKALDPGIMDRKIAELAVEDPEVARMMMELNRVGEEAGSEQVELDAEGERIGIPAPPYRALVERELPASERPKEE